MRFVWRVRGSLFCGKARGEAARLADKIRRTLPWVQAVRVGGRRSSVPATWGKLLAGLLALRGLRLAK
eukprot:4008629-Prorocentrum_lima.AAC.1